VERSSLTEVRLYSLYSFKKESNKSEYVRKFSTCTHLRLVPPGPLFSIPVMSPLHFYTKSKNNIPGFKVE